MSGELEAAGAAVTAGLAARAIDGGTGGEGHGEGACLNCGADLVGAYCHACGQSAHVSRSLSHLLEEALHGLIHFDAKAWRTLPKLMFRPGTLTRDYIQGHRARYISPLALFLFCIFLMFFVFAMTGGPSIFGNGAAPESAQTHAAAPTREAAPQTTPAPEPNGVHVALRTESGDVSLTENRNGERWQDAVREAAERGEFNIDLGDPALNERIEHKLLNPDLALYKVQQAAYKFSFLLVPISLPFLALMFFWKRGVTLYDHVVFILYSLSFMSLLLIGLELIGKLPKLANDILSLPLLFAPPVHMFFQLKGAYALGWFSALWRGLILFVSALVCLIIFFVFILFVGLAG